MSSLFAAVMLTSSLVAAAPAPTSAPAPDAVARADDVYDGRVILSSKAMLTIVAKNGDNVTFAISSSCKITRNGKSSDAEMIAPGDRVTISATMDGGRNVANIITARAAERPLGRIVADE